MDYRRLTELPRALQKITGRSPSYRTLYAAAVDGRIPAQQGENRHWTYATEDLPAIAAALGLASVKPSAAVMAA